MKTTLIYHNNIMEIPNYDRNNDDETDFERLYPYMPKQTFRMLLVGPSGCGKTNLLIHLLSKPLIFYDCVYLYAKNIEQDKYQDLLKDFIPISEKVGYDVIEYSNDKIIPVKEFDNKSQKVIIFDDYVCEKNQNSIVDYLIQGRHKNCSIIYLSQSFYKTPKDIRLNCSHFCIYDVPSKNEIGLITRELGVTKEQYEKATNKPFSFLYVDKPSKKGKRNFYGNI